MATRCLSGSDDLDVGPQYRCRSALGRELDGQPASTGLGILCLTILSCFVLISQNRQAEKDRVRSDIEYEVNIKAELEIAHLHEKTDRIYENMMARFSSLEKQMAANRS